MPPASDVHAAAHRGDGQRTDSVGSDSLDRDSTFAHYLVAKSAAGPSGKGMAVTAKARSEAVSVADRAADESAAKVERDRQTPREIDTDKINRYIRTHAVIVTRIVVQRVCVGAQ